MPHTDLPYSAGGLAMLGTLYLPEGDGPAPGVVVFPEAFGLGPMPAGAPNASPGLAMWRWRPICMALPR